MDLWIEETEIRGRDPWRLLQVPQTRDDVAHVASVAKRMERSGGLEKL